MIKTLNKIPLLIATIAIIAAAGQHQQLTTTATANLQEVNESGAPLDLSDDNKYLPGQIAGHYIYYFGYTKLTGAYFQFKKTTPYDIPTQLLYDINLTKTMHRAIECLCLAKKLDIIPTTLKEHYIKDVDNICEAIINRQKITYTYDKYDQHNYSTT